MKKSFIVKHGIFLLIISFFVFFNQKTTLISQSSNTTNLKGPYLGQNPPGDVPELFAPGIISTCKEHSPAMFTPDGNEVYFARLFTPTAEIYFMKQENGYWTYPQIVPFSGQYKDLYPYLSLDGNTIIFSSKRPIKKGGKKLSQKNAHLWMVQRTKNEWSEPEHMGSLINSDIFQGASSISKNRTIYFNRSDSQNPKWSSEIFRAKFVNDQYLDPENLGEPINSKTPDHCPYIAQDESFIIFSSFRPSRYGMSDLYISFQDQHGKWMKPINLGPKINSNAKDEYPYISADGKYLFFNSNRTSSLNKIKIPEGPGNIYWVSAGIIEEIKQKAFK